jgi:hypothetical protein
VSIESYEYRVHDQPQIGGTGHDSNKLIRTGRLRSSSVSGAMCCGAGRCHGWEGNAINIRAWRSRLAAHGPWTRVLSFLVCKIKVVKDIKAGWGRRRALTDHPTRQSLASARAREIRRRSAVHFHREICIRRSLVCFV